MGRHPHLDSSAPVRVDYASQKKHLTVDIHHVRRVDFISRSVQVFHNFFGSRVPVAVTGIGKRVRIPRCRATVSEEITARHWGDLGRQAVAVDEHRPYS
jgi:hypothetical protein